MNSCIALIKGTKYSTEIPSLLSAAALQPVINFHRSLPAYQPTPLISLPSLAEKLGLQAVFIKDESHRFGLNSFKGLGAAYAAARIVASLVADASLDYTRLTSENAREKLKNVVFVTATDGNHGKGVAWAASLFGCRAIVYMPKGSKQCRADAINSINNTQVTITDFNYDDTVRLAAACAQEHGYYLVQDTGLPGYEETPSHIVQGYSTMAVEAIEQLTNHNLEKPSHVFLQAGVGSMAGSVLGCLTHYYHKQPPVTTIVEPASVACIYESVRSGGGKPQAIGGNPQTCMAGLNCGEPNPLTWPLLRDYAAFFASCPDWVTEYGMKILAQPLGSDTPVISGESGAVGLGLLAALCLNEKLHAYKEMLALNHNSTVLLFSTEGNTDPESYRQIINQAKGEWI